MKRAFVLSTLVLASFAMAQNQERPKQLDWLDGLTGKWMLDEKVSKEKGTCKAAWVLNKRHVQMDFSGTVMDMPMEGLMIVSWDESRNKYVSTWFDSMGGMAISGYGDVKDNTLTTTTEMLDIMGQKGKIRMILTKGKEGFTMNVGMGDGDKYETFLDNHFVRGK